MVRVVAQPFRLWCKAGFEPAPVCQARMPGLPPRQDACATTTPTLTTYESVGVAGDRSMPVQTGLVGSSSRATSLRVIWACTLFEQRPPIACRWQKCYHPLGISGVKCTDLSRGSRASTSFFRTNTSSLSARAASFSHDQMVTHPSRCLQCRFGRVRRLFSAVRAKVSVLPGKRVPIVSAALSRSRGLGIP